MPHVLATRPTTTPHPEVLVRVSARASKDAQRGQMHCVVRGSVAFAPEHLTMAMFEVGN